MDPGYRIHLLSEERLEVRAPCTVADAANEWARDAAKKARLQIARLPAASHWALRSALIAGAALRWLNLMPQLSGTFMHRSSRSYFYSRGVNACVEDPGSYKRHRLGASLCGSGFSGPYDDLSVR